MRRVVMVLGVAVALCAPAPSSAAVPCTSPRFEDGSPSQSLLAAFGVLRRDATPADAWPRPGLLPSRVSFYRGWFRRARSLGGYRFYLLPGHRSTPCGSPPELFIGALGSRSTVSGGADLAQVKRYGEWTAQGVRGGSIVVGLLPDRVATVTVTYPAGRGHPGGISYPHAVRRTVRVRHNMAVFRLSRPPDDASSPSRQVWRSRSGRVIRRAPGNP